MKKFAALIAVIIMTVLAVPMNAFAGEMIKTYANLLFENAPEGTVCIDLLIKLDEDDENYVPFNDMEMIGYSIKDDYTSSPLKKTSESEIVRYKKNGYVSLMSHYKNAERFTLYDKEYVADSGSKNLLMLNVKTYSFKRINRKYGKIKAAYLDKDGNILGITKKLKTINKVSLRNIIRADGDTLYFTIARRNTHLKSAASIIVLIFMIAVYVSPIFAVVWLIVINVKYNRNRKKEDSDKSGDNNSDE